MVVIILTGGGSQLKHLIQLTEYVTGLNARIGYPNEHLAAGHIEELAKPTYSTCIGLILKGYDDYEHNRKQFEQDIKKVDVPDGLKDSNEWRRRTGMTEAVGEESMKNRKSLKGFWGNSKMELLICSKKKMKSILIIVIAE